jgi:hypothetical protein
MPRGAQGSQSPPDGLLDTGPATVAIDPADIRRALAFSTATNTIDNPLFSPHNSPTAWASLTKEQMIPAMLASLISFRALNPLTGYIEENPHILPPVGVVIGILLAHDRPEKDKSIALLCALNYPLTPETRRTLGSAITEATRYGLLPLELTNKAAQRLAIKQPGAPTAPTSR